MSSIDSNQDGSRKEHMETANEIAEETRNRTSNGNQYAGDQDSDQNPKTGGAERGGPGSASAMKRQPPDATRPSVEGPKQSSDRESGTDVSEKSDFSPNSKAQEPSESNHESIQGSGGLVNPVNGPNREIN